MKKTKKGWSVKEANLSCHRGVGVKKYKQKLAKRSGMKDYNKEKLCEYPSDLR